MTPPTSLDAKTIDFRHLNGMHWVVLSLSIILTLLAWFITREQVEERTQAQFEYQADQIIELVQERMSKYEEALWAGVAALHMLDDTASRSDWSTFAKSLKIESRFPGINGIGVIHYVPERKYTDYVAWQRQQMPNYDIHPVHNEENYWPITYVKPQVPNLKAVGLDMAHETNRFTAAKMARDSGKAAVTGPIILVQDAQKTPGFLFYVPWYSNNNVPSVYGDDGSGFLGLVYAPFIMYKLMDGVLSNTNRQVNFSIHDGDFELYNELTSDSQEYDPNPLFTSQKTIELYGRPWTFTLQSSMLFRDQFSHSQPLLILIAGLVIDTLLFFVFLILARSKQRAVAYANEVTADLRVRQEELKQANQHIEARNRELEEANAELDQFAYVASHDLKAPLRGISQLVEWMREDLEEQLTPETTEYFRLLRNRVARLEALLNDLLIYSRIGRKEGKIEIFNVKEDIAEIYAMQNPPNGMQLCCETDIEALSTLTTPLSQVIRNLIGNAIKHHDSPEQGLINITVNRVENGYRFRVADNGPGIPEEHRTRVFELFHTLKPRDEVEGSGMGLSIIKKILDRYNADYTIETNGERGCAFIFVWPTLEQEQGHPL